MNTTNTKEPFTQDPELTKKIMKCKQAFEKWELDKAKKPQVNPAKKFTMLPKNVTLSKLSKFDKIVLLTVGIYIVWVLVALWQLEQVMPIDYMDSPIDIPNSTNTTNIT